MKEKTVITKILEEAKGRGALLGLEAKQVLSIYNIPFPKQGLAMTIDEAVRIADEIGYTVALKVQSPDILHKTDAKCVKLNVSSPNMVKEAYIDLLRAAKEHKPDAKIWGVLVQEMIEGAREVIIGMKRDPTFGPIVLFGLGGIFVEVLKDVAIRVTPFSRSEALDMIREIRGYPILEKFRAQPPADIESVANIIMNIARLAQDFREISEIDLNPVLVREEGKGAVAVDARIIIEKS